MQDFEVSRGQEVTMSVTADGSPLPTCTWYHNDKPLQVQPNRVVIVDNGPTHNLTLLDVQLTDDGQYKVRDLSNLLFISCIGRFSHQGCDRKSNG